MQHDEIVITGARQHNLKNITVRIPRDRLVVITGLSGSGKSSLAFDTIYAEGQRRYVESLSAYARQFLGQMDKPDVDHIEGLSPAISIDQKGASHNPRSTVGTVTEIYDYLRLLYARVGRPHCPKCGRRIQQQSVEQIVDRVLALDPGTRLMVLAPLVRDRKGEYQKVFDDVRRAGFVRVRVDGEVFGVDDEIKLDRYKMHRIEVVVDRLVVPDSAQPTEAGADTNRIADSIEQALRLGEGTAIILPLDGEEQLYSEHFACVHCNLSFGEFEPRNFSFNSPHGACPECTGLGTRLEVDPGLVIPNRDLSLAEGAIAGWGKAGMNGNVYYRAVLESVAEEYGFSSRTPVKDLTDEQLKIVLYGLKGKRIKMRYTPKSGRVHEYQMIYEGVIPNLERRFRETDSEFIRGEIERFMSSRPCPKCGGARLKPESRAVTVVGRPIEEVTALSIADAVRFFQDLEARRPIGTEPPSNGSASLSNGTVPLPPDNGRFPVIAANENPPLLGGRGAIPGGPASSENGKSARSRSRAAKVAEPSERWAAERTETLSDRDFAIARQILKEFSARLGFLLDVGLDYLSLDRATGTLSGGEAQRIRLATQIGSGLMGVIYILDEPSIGLHQRDNARLVKTLQRLRDLGNTLIVVEHDEDTMRAADWVIDIGPGAGEHGGRVVAAGRLEDLLAEPESLTGQFLSGARRVPVPAARRPGNGRLLRIVGARENNLKDLTVELPLGKLVCVTGVSGSGKSSLVTEILYRALAQSINRARERAGEYERIEGLEHLDKVVEIDQSPIGRTPRSNPATYTGLFTPIRELFAAVPESRLRGYRPGRFSFNVKGGRCEACEGDGILKIEMQFLPDVYVPCEVCKGRRYNRETLEVQFKGKTIAEVLDLTVEEALAFFQDVPPLRNKLQTLFDVGLGYIRLGQPATTLSGGEAQRVKLASELSRRATGRTIYILDEPTTGLHFADVERLLQVLNRLADTGNTVVVIEHNLDVIKTADWLIDLGPEGGARGGEIIAVGTPEDVAACPESFTGRFLAPLLREQSAVLVDATPHAAELAESVLVGGT